MRIAILASEGAPYAKSGGLGDVMEALPSALAKIPGNEVVLILPYYQKIKNNPKYNVELVTQFNVALGWRQQYAGIFRLKDREDGVQVYFVDNHYYFGARSGAIYGDLDDGERFSYFSKACLDTLVALNFIPDVIQCNDWQTAMVPTFLASQYYPLFPGTKCMFTIHNVEYQGWANSYFFDDVLYPSVFRAEIMTPLGNAMRFIDGIERDLDLLEHRYIFGLGQRFGSNIEKRCGARHQIALDFCYLRLVQRRVEEMGDTVISCNESTDGVDLILHKGDQR